MKKSYFKILTTFLCLSFFTISIGFAQTSYTVGANGQNFTTIQEAIDDASVENGDIINIIDNIHTEAGIVITKDLTIKGQGKDATIVQAAESVELATDRVFEVSSENSVSFLDLTIRHGSTHDLGGGIFSKGNLNIERCVISNNKANDQNASESGGGGILTYGVLNIKDSEISNNTTSAIGGGILSVFNSTRIYMENCIVKNNIANEGGGIYQIMEYSPEEITCDIKNSLIVGNVANEYYSGLAARYASISLNSVTISKNKTQESAGGFSCYNSDLYIINSIIAGNISNEDPNYADFGISDVVCTSNGYNLIGFNYGFEPHETDLVGGSYDPKLDSEFTPSISSVCKNTGHENFEVLNISDVDVYGNPRLFNDRIDIGAVESQSTMTLPNYLISVSEPSINLGSIPLDTTMYYGLLIKNSGTENLILDSIFVDGAYEISLTEGEPHSTSLYNIEIEPGSSKNIYISLKSDIDGTFLGELSIFSNADNLPEIFLPIQTIVVKPDYFTGDIFIDATWCADTVHVGSNVKVGENTTLTICPGTVVNFLGDYYLEINGQLLSNGLEGDTVIFTTNTAEWSGIRFVNIEMTENDTSYLTYTKIEKGKANTSDWKYKRGGGIYMDKSTKLIIRNSEISENSAENTGGGIYNYNGFLEITNSLIKNNSTWDDNGSGGSGIANYGFLKISNSIISNNSCDYTGGGISNNGTLYIENSTVKGNYSYRSGGGIYINGGNVNILNSLVVNNRTLHNYGCGIHVSGGTVNITNSTIYGNYTADDAGGGGIGMYNGIVNLLNTIIAGNSANSYDNIYRSSGTINSLGYNLIGTDDGYTFPAVEGDITGTNSSPIDPFLNSDYSLRDISIAVNNGIPDTMGLNIPNIDAFGYTRIYDGDVDRIDIGASELQSNPTIAYRLGYSPSSLDFQLVNTSDFSYKDVKLFNLGSGDIIVDSIKTSIGYYVSFTGSENLVDTLKEDFVIPAYTDAILTVAFNPSIAQTYSGNIEIVSNDSNEPVKSISVTGNGRSNFILSGNISKDSTICTDTIYVNSDIVIENGVTLELCPGIVVMFNDDYRIEVQGTILAQGTENDTIKFTNLNGNGDWGGIIFNKTDELNNTSKFNYVLFEHAESYHSYGGAIYVDNFSKIDISNCVFKNNHASNGGAVYITNTSLTIDSCLFENNSASAYGGALYTGNHEQEEEVNILNSVFFNNSSSFGGAISVKYASNLDVNIVNTKLQKNNVYMRGGAIYAGRFNTLNLDHVLLAENYLTWIHGKGGGMYIEDGIEVRISNSTITVNTASKEGGGIYVASPNVYLSNSVITNNSGSASYKDIYVGGAIISEGYNFIGNIGSENWEHCSGDIIGTSSKPLEASLDPNFVPAETSYLVNSGNLVGVYPEFDLEGNPRIFDGIEDIIDIGAFEFQGDKVIQSLILDIETTPINFDYQQIGESSYSYSIPLRNIEGNHSIKISSITVPEGFKLKIDTSAQYVSSLTDIYIEPNHTISLEIIMEPLSEQEYSGNLVINSNASETVINVLVAGYGANFKPSFVFRNSAPIVDGTKDDLWNSITPNLLNVELMGTVHDLETMFRSVWNNDSLYLLIEVKDDSLYNLNADSSLNDNIELYLDFNNSKGTSYDANDYMIRFNWARIQYSIENGSALSGLHFEQTTSNDSRAYFFEIAIPWSSIGIVPTSGTEIGFDMNIIDNDGFGVDDEMAWYSDANDKNTNPSKFGTVILLDEDGLDPLKPELQIIHEDLNFDIACEDSIIIPVTFKNIGSVRNLLIGKENSLENVLSNINSFGNLIQESIPDKFNFTDGITGYRIDDGGEDMFDNGNRLKTNYQSDINYSNNTIIESNAFGTYGRYFTSKLEGLFILAADVDNVDYFEITGYGGDSDAEVDGTVIHQTVKGTHYTGFVKRVYNSSTDPSINHLIITESTNSSHSFNASPYYEEHRVDNLNEAKRVYYLLYGGTKGKYIDNKSTKRIMYEFLSMLPTGTDTIISGDSMEKEYVVYTDYLENEIIDDSIIVFSNDPNNLIKSIPYTINKDGFSQIELGVNTLDFGEVLEDHFGEEQVTIENTGCGVLVIDSITSSSPYFFALETSMEIEPESTKELTLYFYPEVKDEFSEFITIHTDDRNVSINVKGATMDTIAPVISVTYVDDERPNVLVVEFDEEIRDPENYIGFSIEGTTGEINDITLANSNTLEFSLSADVLFGEMLLLNYNDSVTNIFDTSKRYNKLENFIDLQVVNNVEFLDAVAPTLVKASVENANPNQLILEFDEIVLAENHSGISINGTTAIATEISGSGTNVLTVTLDANVLYGEILTLDYNSGTITDKAKTPNALASISNYSAHNNVAYVDIFAPNFVSATIEDATPSQIDLVFDEIVTINEGLGFSFTGKSVTGISGSGTNTISFTLDIQVEFGDFIQMWYAANLGDVYDVAQTPNALETLNSIAVTNKVEYNGSSSVDPIVIDASIENSNPSEVVLVFDEDVTLSSYGAFWVSEAAANINGFSGSGNDTIILNLDAPIQYGETVLLRYDDVGNVQDIDGNPLAAFMGLTVINNVEFVDNVVPTILSAKVNNNTPTVITLELSENVVFTDATGFTIDGTTGLIVSATGSGTNQISIELNAAVVFGDAITFDYDQATGNVTDQATVPNSLASFTGYNVANYVEHVDVIKPQVISAKVENSNPYEIVIEFSEKVTYTDFSGITINGTTGTISGISGNNSEILSLTLDTDIIYSDVLTLDYNSSNITDMATTPNSLDDFTGVAIINNTEGELINPYFTSAILEDAERSEIEVSLSENVYFTDYTGFTVSGISASITGLNGSGTSSLTFTLDADAVYKGDIVLNYSGKGNLTDRVGNILMLTNYPVVNNIVPKTIATLGDLIVNGTSVSGFDAGTLTYDAELANGTTTVPTVTATSTDVNADISIVDATALPGSTVVTVTAQDGVTENDYTINFTVALNADASLSDLQVDGATISGFDSGTLVYDVELAYGTTTVPGVTATSTDVNADISIVDATSLPGSTVVTVTSEDGEAEITYTVNFTVAPNTDASLSNLQVDGVTVSGFDSGIFSYNVEFAYGTTTVPAVTVTSTDANANTSIAEAMALPGSTVVTVTAEDGETEDVYTINFTIAAPNTDASLSDIQVDGSTVSGFDSGTLTYDVELASGTTTVPTVTATSADVNADVSIVDATALPGSTVVTVTAEDGVTKNVYTINFAVATSIFDNIEDNVFKIYPNPSNGIFFLDITRYGAYKAKIEIINMLGVMIYEEESSLSDDMKIDASELKKGMYLVKISTDTKTYTKRIIIK